MGLEILEWAECVFPFCSRIRHQDFCDKGFPFTAQSELLCPCVRSSWSTTVLCGLVSRGLLLQRETVTRPALARAPWDEELAEGRGFEISEISARLW